MMLRVYGLAVLMALYPDYPDILGHPESCTEGVSRGEKLRWITIRKVNQFQAIYDGSE